MQESDLLQKTKKHANLIAICMLLYKLLYFFKINIQGNILISLENTATFSGF